MEAAQTTAPTAAAHPAAAPTPAAAEIPELSPMDIIGAALEGVTPDETPAEGAEAAAADKPADDKAAKEEKPKDKAPDEAAAAKKRADDLFTDAALATPDGVKRAREHLEKQRRKNDQYDIKLSRRARELDTHYEAQRSEIEKWRPYAKETAAVVADIQSEDPLRILDALGRATGKDGRKVFERMTQAMIRQGKAAAPGAEVEKLTQQVAQLTEHIKKGEQQSKEQAAAAERQRDDATIRRRITEVAQLAADATRFPTVAQYVAAGRSMQVVGYVNELKQEALDQGLRLSDEDACAKIESELKLLSSPAAGTSAESGTGTDRPQGEPRRARPSASSISPSVARSAPSPRELTDAERQEELARDTDYLRGLGLQI